MPTFPESLNRARAAAHARPAWEALQNERPPKRRPRQMRPVEERLTDPNEGVRRQATEQFAREQSRRNQFYADAMQNELGRNEVNTPPNAYFGQDVLEMTGAPALSRSFDAIAANDPERALTEGAWGALGILGTATLPAGGGRGALRPQPRAPLPPTRIYRGINQEYDAARAAALGDRWWHTNPEVASTYAPGSEGAHVIPGMVDEGALNMAHIELPPGTVFRSIPVEALPPDIRRAFPRGTTVTNSHEVAAAAESAGYDGITFAGMRDSGFGAAMDGAYPGFGTGDDGRVVAIFNDSSVRSPFGETGLPASRGALRGGSDDLAEAALPASRAPDAGQPGAETEVTRIYRGTPHATTQWRPSRHRPDDEHILGEGVYATTARDVAQNRYALNGGSVHEADVAGRLISQSEWLQRVQDVARRMGIADTSRAGWTRAERQARQEFMRDGYVGIRAAPDNAEAEIVVWPEARSAIRPVIQSPDGGAAGGGNAGQGGNRTILPRDPATTEQPVLDNQIHVRRFMAYSPNPPKTEMHDIIQYGRDAVRRVPVDEIVATQTGVSRNFRKRGTFGPPEVVLVDGRYYVRDGHNRIARDIDRGARSITARVYEANPASVTPDGGAAGGGSFEVRALPGGEFEARIDGRVVGRLNVDVSMARPMVDSVAVEPAFRRQGVATQLYRAAEESLGRRLEPSGALSDDGFQFWSDYRPEAVAGDLRNHREALIGQMVETRYGPARVVSVSGNEGLAELSGGGRVAIPRAEIARLRANLPTPDTPNAGDGLPPQPNRPGALRR